MDNNIISNLKVSLNVGLEIDSKTIDTIANLLLIDARNNGYEGIILSEDIYGHKLIRGITREEFERVVEFLDKESEDRG